MYEIVAGRKNTLSGGGRMSRLSVVLRMVLVAMLVGFGWVSSASAKTLKISAAHADSESSVFHKAMLKFKAEVEANSGGEIAVDVFPNGQLGSIREMVEGIQMGTIDVATAASSVLANFSPKVGVYDLPFLLDGYEHAYRTLDGAVGAELNADLAANNIKVLGWWPLGFRNMTTNGKKEIHTVDDLQGIRIRVMASKIYQEMFRPLGIDPVPMGWGEVFTALQQGVVDGQENPYINILDANIFEVNNTIVVTQHTFSPAGLLMSGTLFESLTDAQKKVVTDAAKAATEVARQECEARNAHAKEVLETEKGMKIIAMDKAPLREKTKGVYEAHPEFAELVEMINKAR